MSEPKILELEKNLTKTAKDLQAKMKTNITTGTEFETSFVLDKKKVYGKRIKIGKFGSGGKYFDTGLSNVTLVACFGNAYNSAGYAPVIPGREVGVHFENVRSCNRVWVVGVDGYSAILTILYTKNA